MQTRKFSVMWSMISILRLVSSQVVGLHGPIPSTPKWSGATSICTLFVLGSMNPKENLLVWNEVRVKLRILTYQVMLFTPLLLVALRIYIWISPAIQHST